MSVASKRCNAITQASSMASATPEASSFAPGAALSASITSTCALRAGGWAAQGRAARRNKATLTLMRPRGLASERRGAPRLGTQPAVERVEIGVDHRHHDQRQERAGDHAADDGAAHRRLLLGAFADAQRKRQ